MDWFTKDVKKLVFELPDLKYDTALEMINFMYTDRIENLKRNAQSLLIAAKAYKLSRLLKMCEKSLFDNMTIENSIGTLIIANQQSLEELQYETFSFMERNVREIIKTLDWDEFVNKHSFLFNDLLKLWVQNNENGSVKNESFEKPSVIEHVENVLNNDFDDLYEKQLFTDISFKIQGNILKAHKSILCTRSEVFRQMLMGKDVSEIQIDGVSYEAFKELLRFIYCERVNNLKLIALDLLPAADKVFHLNFYFLIF